MKASEADNATASLKKSHKSKNVRVYTSADMADWLARGGDLLDLDVRGDSFEYLTTALEGEGAAHPVMDAITRRLAEGSKPGARTDGIKLALAVEGGGMRGCISAGMISSLIDLGIMPAIDAVFGSSAGSLVGAYGLSGQPPRVGCSVYYDALTGRGRHFIDTRYLLRAMGLGLLGLPLTRKDGLRDMLTNNIGESVLNLNYLLKQVVPNQVPLDWEGFWKVQEKQPLHVVASSLKSQRSVALSSEKGNFSSLDELTECMRASMLLPGIAGGVVTLPSLPDDPLVDSQLFEPMPFRSAIEAGYTHVLVLRSRPDDINVVAATKLPERMIMRRFFKRKYGDVEAYEYMKRAGHKKVYAEDILALNEGARAGSRSTKGPHLLPISLSKGSIQVGRLERTREGILEGVRRGYEHAHAILRKCSTNKELTEMDGWNAALKCFPDEILESDIDVWARDWLVRNRSSK